MAARYFVGLPIDWGILDLTILLPVFNTKYKTNVSLELPADVENFNGLKKAQVKKLIRIETNENAIFVIGNGWSDQTFQIFRCESKFDFLTINGKLKNRSSKKLSRTFCLNMKIISARFLKKI